MVSAPDEIKQLEQLLARLPGLGPRSARRAVLHMLERPESLMLPLSNALSLTVDRVRACSTCGNIDVVSPCRICIDSKRDASLICVVETVADLWAMQRVSTFRGHFHVLGGVLSALDGKGPEDLNISRLIERARADDIKEVVLALPVTVDGQTTAHYLAQRLTQCGVSLSQLAHGVPVGGELDYLDEGTISNALVSRRSLSVPEVEESDR